VKNRRSFLLKDAPVAAFASAAAWAEFASRTQTLPLLGWPGDSQSGENNPVDAGQFARVVTSDPTRMDGARAQRTEEYRAEDIFLETDVPPAADGSYVVPTADDGLGTIGLVWYERRPINALEVQFADPSHVPAPEGVRVQAWVGTESPHYGMIAPWETLWQGRWVSLPGAIQRLADRWRLGVDLKAIPDAQRAAQKIRWIFPPSTEKIAIRRLSAFTDDIWDTTELRMELEKPTKGKHAEIELYNGELLGPARHAPLDWDVTGPLLLKLRYVKKAAPPGSTHTLIWFKLPNGAYAVAANDVLEHEYVYIPEAGLLVTTGSAGISLSQVRNQIARKKTILERVREMPDQTMAQAMEKAHHSQRDSGPMLLSLACDDSKWILEPEGTVLAGSSKGFVSKLGAGETSEFTTHLRGGWLPVPVRTTQDGGATYRQTTFVAPYEKNGPTQLLPWLKRRPLGVVQYSVENTSTRPTSVSVALGMATDWNYRHDWTTEKRSAWLAQKRPFLPLRPIPQGAVVGEQGKLLAYVDTRETSPLRTELEDNVLRLEGMLPPGAKADCWVYLPRWEMNMEDYAQLQGGQDLLSEVEAYWKGILGSGTQIELPDPVLMNLIRASQVQGLISSRNEADGERIEQWGASMSYRGLNALYYIIPAMDALGYHDFARRALEYYIPRYTSEGLLSDGYTLAGIGWHLELLWDHYLLTRDRDWLQHVSPQIERACWWIVRQKEKTKKLDPQGNKLPEYGLAPPGLTADWANYNYYFLPNEVLLRRSASRSESPGPAQARPFHPQLPLPRSAASRWLLETNRPTYVDSDLLRGPPISLSPPAPIIW
jgi:hypothetical protein